LLLWTGRLIDNNRDDIAAASTLAVAFFTGTLWWVTWGMVHIARDQRADTVRSIEAAERAANAAEKTANVTAGALIHTRDAFRSENRAFLCPGPLGINRIYVEGNVSQWRFSPRWDNSGKTPAINVVMNNSFTFIPSSGIPSGFDYPDGMMSVKLIRRVSSTTTISNNEETTC
jgi:hypothetical protein